MKIKHHVVRKFHDAKKAPLWKWAVIIFIVIAMPLFFSFSNRMQTQQAIDVDDQETAAVEKNN